MVNMSPKDVVLCERWLHFANCLDAARELDDGEKLVMRQNYGLYVFMRKLRVKICALGTWRRLVSSYCGFALARVVKYHAMAYAVDYLGAVCKIQRWNRRLLACSSLKGFLTKMRVNSKMAYYVNQRLGNDKQDVFKGIIVTQDLNLNDTNIICAIKKIRLSEIEKESEILAMKKTLEHGKNENVLRLLALQRTREYMYMALELCDGSLGDSDVFSIGNGILQHPSIKVEICQQLLAGIDHIHSLKVFHRDIKPHNILFKLRRDGKIQIKVADMGSQRCTTQTAPALQSRKRELEHRITCLLNSLISIPKLPCVFEAMRWNAWTCLASGWFYFIFLRKVNTLLRTGTRTKKCRLT